MAQFLLETKHPMDMCLETLDLMAEKDPDLLKNFFWGCKEGSHVGWGIVDADSEEEVRAVLPEDLQDSARITEVNRYTADQIRKMHKAA